MFINNITGQPIKDITFDGYWFTIPAGVSICWDKFGEWLLKDIYKLGDGGTLPPVIVAPASSWKGDRYVEVRRFELDSKLIPSRKDLIRIAKQRGVDPTLIEQFNEDETIEPADIAKAISDLPVPEDIKYPKAQEIKPEVSETTEVADKVVADALNPTTPAKPAEIAPSVAEAPVRPARSFKTEKAPKKAAVAPKTPPKPKKEKSTEPANNVQN